MYTFLLREFFRDDKTLSPFARNKSSRDVTIRCVSSFFFFFEWPAGCAVIDRKVIEMNGKTKLKKKKGKQKRECANRIIDRLGSLIAMVQRARKSSPSSWLVHLAPLFLSFDYDKSNGWNVAAVTIIHLWQ